MRIRPAILMSLMGKNRFLIASCDEGQESIEAETRGHGLFTFHLLDGIRGTGDRDGDGKVGVAELFEHVAAAVESEASAMGMVQRPWSSAIGPGGVYIAKSANGTGHLSAQAGGFPAFAEIERLWRSSRPEGALKVIDQAFENSSEGELGSILELLKRKGDLADIPFFFRGLVHRSEAIRVQVKRIIQGIGWTRVAEEIERLARQGDPERFGFILSGLAAFESHKDVVVLLDRLVDILKGDLRNRTIHLLDRKRQGLELERIAEIFRISGSPYQIRKALGQGRFTAAYLARDVVSDLEVVVRVLRPRVASEPQLRAQFLDLIRSSVRMVHQNLVMTRGLGSLPDHGLYFSVRDYVDGVTLQRLLELGRDYTTEQIVTIVGQLLQALKTVHAEGLLHGAVQPSNIFLCSNDRVVLGDMALPVLTDGLVPERRSYDYRYASPEIFRQNKSIDAASDFYSLGCVVHELACGVPPFESDNHFELAALHLREPVQHPSNRGSRLGKAGDEFVLKLLEMSPGNRYSTVDSALRALLALESALRPRSRSDVAQGPIVGDESLDRYGGDYMMSVLSLTLNPPTASSVRDNLTCDLVANEDGPMPPVDSSRVDPPPTLADATGAEDAERGHLVSIPENLGNYKILGMLGRGGMGRVLLAEDVRLHRKVALKLVQGRTSARFQREALVLARLNHPNIVSIYELGESDGQVFIVSEYLEGMNLHEQLKHDGPFSCTDAARLMLTLAGAVAYAHERGVIHRDLKPSNIILDQDGAPKILDFGLAKISGGTELAQGDQFETSYRQLVGTPAYMSPEQARGENHRIGFATDIFSLGTILYQLLTGELPFASPSLTETLSLIMHASPRPLRQLRPEIPRDLEAICLRCLEKSQAGRYPSAADFAADLERCLRGEAVLARPGGEAVLARPGGGALPARPLGFWGRVLRLLRARK